MKDLLKRVEAVGQEFGLRVNYRKSKIMIFDRGNTIKQIPTIIGNCQVVESFIYLGVNIYASGSIRSVI